MQNPDEDTQWNDILREKGILPSKEKEITEEEIVQLVDSTVQGVQSIGKKLESLDLDELDELEDDEDERVLLEFRNKRLAEMKAQMAKATYGDVREISAVDYKQQVNNAGKGVWVVLHLYKQGIPLCALINNHMDILAKKFPATKFLKAISTTCVPNFPDRNVPTCLVYHEGELIKQFIGPTEFRGMNLTTDELEWLFSKTGAVKTELSDDPRPKIKDVLFTKLSNYKPDISDDENDW